MFIAECWAGTQDIHGFGGIPHNFTTLDECQAFCFHNTTCVAIDWEPSNAPKSCWILASTDTGDTTEDRVITHYELNQTCRG